MTHKKLNSFIPRGIGDILDRQELIFGCICVKVFEFAFCESV